MTNPIAEYFNQYVQKPANTEENLKPFFNMIAFLNYPVEQKDKDVKLSRKLYADCCYFLYISNKLKPIKMADADRHTVKEFIDSWNSEYNHIIKYFELASKTYLVKDKEIELAIKIANIIINFDRDRVRGIKLVSLELLIHYFNEKYPNMYKRMDIVDVWKKYALSWHLIYLAHIAMPELLLLNTNQSNNELVITVNGFIENYKEHQKINKMLYFYQKRIILNTNRKNYTSKKLSKHTVDFEHIPSICDNNFDIKNNKNRFITNIRFIDYKFLENYIPRKNKPFQQ